MARIASAQVAVVGGGPAGLAAARAAASLGVGVGLIDGGARLGGQFHRQAAPGVGARDASRSGRFAGSRAPSPHGRELIAAVEDSPVEVRSRTRVWQASGEDGGVLLRLLGPDGAEQEIFAEAVVLAPGAIDRGLPFPGWDLPGVLTPGGAQTLLKASGTLPGQRVLVSGAGPLLLAVAALLAGSGAEVAAVLDATDRRRLLAMAGPLLGPGGRSHLGEAAGYLFTLGRRRVPLRSGWATVAARGEGRVEEAEIARVDRSWRPVAGTERTIAVDTICSGFGFTAMLELPLALGCAVRRDPVDGALAVAVNADGASSVAGVYVAGEATGIGGADLAETEGTLAGLAAAEYCGATALAKAELRRSLKRRRLDQERFAAALRRALRVPLCWSDKLADRTPVCRCEEVSAGEIRAAVNELGATDARSAKLLCRAGMGLCQGRVCGTNVAEIVAHELGAEADPLELSRRPIAEPIPLGGLADDQGSDRDTAMDSSRTPG
jgi:NADPH-dependent 2,4-dienoyl-CoA reductase/sulfur reductase-like enzyme